MGKVSVLNGHNNFKNTLKGFSRCAERVNDSDNGLGIVIHDGLRFLLIDLESVSYNIFVCVVSTVFLECPNGGVSKVSLPRLRKQGR